MPLEVFGVDPDHEHFLHYPIDLASNTADVRRKSMDLTKALARLLIQQGIIQKETFIATMREVAHEEIEESDEITNFLSETFAEILDQLAVRAEKARSEQRADQ